MKKIYLILSILLINAGVFSQESLNVHWPEKYKWKVISNQENEAMHVIELIPGKEKPAKWTLLGMMTSYKNLTSVPLGKMAGLLFEQSKEAAPQATLTILEQDTTATYPWILFKIESPGFTNDPIPESQLWYLKQGKTSLFSAFVAAKKPVLESSFLEEWSPIFKASEVVILE